MNIDANIQKIISAVLKKWKLVVALALIGAVLAYFYTANFTTLTYSSSVEFFTFVVDSRQEFNDSSTTAQQASNTSKMNYATKMLNTYIELFKTYKFNQEVATAINESDNSTYSAGAIKGAVSYEIIEETTMFKVYVRTTDPNLSYRIAKQLEISIPEKMKDTNNGLINASVEDAALKASASESLDYPKKCLVGALAGAVIACAYIILRDLLDIRIKSSDELPTLYEVPVLGTIPEFELKQTNAKTEKVKREK